VSITAGAYLAMTKFTSQFSETDQQNDQFIFVIHCGDSVNGKRTKQTRECLNLFIRSLVVNSFFDIVPFGSNFEVFFPEPDHSDEKP
jgi:hypothetical protein